MYRRAGARRFNRGVMGLKKRIAAGLCLLLFLTPVFPAAATGAVTGAGTVAIDLADAVAMALANPLNLGAAEAAVAEAAAGLDKARAAQWPGLSVSTSVTRVSEQPSMMPQELIDLIPGYTGPTGDTGPAELYSTGFSLSWPLYTGGRVRSGIAMAELGLEASRMEYKNQRDQTLYRTVVSYINLLQAGEMVELSRQSVAMVEEHLAMVEFQYELGAATATDLLATEIHLSQAQQGAARAEHAKTLAAMNLRSLLGLERGEELVLAGINGLRERDFPLPSPEEAAAIAMEARPEPALLRNYLALAKENLEAAKAFWKPNVVLVGKYGADGRPEWEFSDPVLSLTLAVEATLFSGGGNRAAVKEREAAVAKADYAYRQAVAGIELEINQKYLGVTEARQAWELARLTLRQAQENYEFTQARYQLGAAGPLEVLTAQNTLHQCRFEELTAGYGYFLAVMEFYHTMGRIESFLEEVKS